MIQIGSIQGNVTVNDVHDNQVVYVNMTKADGEHEEVNVEQEEANGDPAMVLPAELATPQAMHLWEQAAMAGWTDGNHQPLISRTLAAVLADHMAGLLGISNKWKLFESFWRRNNMRGDYNDALEQKQYGEFLDKMKKIIC